VPSCPICRKPVAPRASNSAFPFCSDRCKLLDLGKWLGEDYRIPGPRLGDGAERPPAEPDPRDEE
jgi:endogenous inhibitor of DNA gyrase (YacG/DUF329 family)